MIQRIRRAWCRWRHNTMSRPVRGEWVCLTCLARHRVPWAPQQPQIDPDTLAAALAASPRFREDMGI